MSSDSATPPGNGTRPPARTGRTPGKQSGEQQEQDQRNGGQRNGEQRNDGQRGYARRTNSPQGRDRRDAGQRDADRRGPNQRDAGQRDTDRRERPQRFHEEGGPQGRGRSRDGVAPDKGISGPGGKTRGAAGALIELDRDLMKLLVRRATLVSRIRGGKDHAAGPAAVQAEKAVRVAWETGALSFSKDPRFSRDLFALLQDIKVLSKERAQESGSFHLAPPKREISGVITGPTSARAAQMRLALAAFLGRPLTLEGASLCAALIDTVKTLSQAGLDAQYVYTGTGTGSVTLAALQNGKTPLAVPDKSLYVGEDLFSLHLFALFAAGKPGIWRFTGGPRLKNADLSPLRQVLPLFGARLAHVVPRSHGLPANVECSGDIPPLVVVPPDLSFEGLCALLLAPLAWDAPVTLNLAALPAALATAALAEVRPLHREVGAEVETHGPHIVFNQAQLLLPEKPVLPLDPALSSYALALPALSGGGLTLRGPWPERMPEAVQVADLLAWAGLALADSGSSISVKALGEPFTLPLQASEFPPQLTPLFLVFAALRQSLSPDQPLALPDPLPISQDDTDMALAAEFLDLLGMRLENGCLVPAPDQDPNAPQKASPKAPWTAPDAFWSMGLSLGAFIKPGLKLANPGATSGVMPSFWSIYNSLPEPNDPALAVADKQEESADAAPARRRIIAN